jgi:hypothetical protein
MSGRHRGDRRRAWTAILLALAWAAPSRAAAAPAVSMADDNVHSIMLTDCSKYSDWQTVASVFAWKQSGQKGTLSKSAACTDEGACGTRRWWSCQQLVMRPSQGPAARSSPVTSRPAARGCRGGQLQCGHQGAGADAHCALHGHLPQNR